MAGVKGRSGRYSLNYARLGLEHLFPKMIHIAHQYINDTREPLKDRAEYSRGFLLKQIPDQINHAVVSVSLSDPMAAALIESIAQYRLKPIDAAVSEGATISKTVKKQVGNKL